MESELLFAKHILLHVTEENIITDFCGLVYNVSQFDTMLLESDTIIYVYGDMETIVIDSNNVNVITDLSINYSATKYNLINLGEVPINVHNVGIYFKKLFNSESDYYTRITTEHNFQSLTDSDKPGTALRSGIYLSEVIENNDETMFNLLRCSTNFTGPTDNFRETDREIIDKINYYAGLFFSGPALFNHVLAQSYDNIVTVAGGVKKQRKAKISKHSDKTKDMPANGLIAFCTFYKNYGIGSFDNYSVNGFDYCYKNISVLTRLRFCLKSDVTVPLVKQFDVVLYPNSVFIIPLSTNRLYTHEIFPSSLPVDKIPIRMGYVVRCSNVTGVYKNGSMYIRGDQYQDQDYVLENATRDGIRVLKELYLKENITSERVVYDSVLNFSLNSGDYVKPII